MASIGNVPGSLWEKAFQLLDSNTQQELGPSKTNRRDVLVSIAPEPSNRSSGSFAYYHFPEQSAVLQEVEKARDLALRKRWKFTKPNGDVVIVRDVMEKTAGWIQRFKETGDAAVQYDPAHAALPWAAFRFLLQTTVSEVQVFTAVATDREYLNKQQLEILELTCLKLKTLLEDSRGIA